MLDHVGINVSDYDRGRDFYAKALAPLGYTLLMEPAPHTGGFGREGKPDFFITDQRVPTTETSGSRSTFQFPKDQRTGGGSWRWCNCSGYSESKRVRSVSPCSAPRAMCWSARR